MYKFISHTWNTVKGECPHGCVYCYMKRWKQKPVRFDEKELKTGLGDGNFIFVGSSCDMFAENIPGEWIKKTLTACANYENKYFFQSKNPARFHEFVPFLERLNIKSVFCTTLETNRLYSDYMKNSPAPEKRVEDMERLCYEKYITVEPIMDFDLCDMVSYIKRINPNRKRASFGQGLK